MSELNKETPIVNEEEIKEETVAQTPETVEEKIEEIKDPLDAVTEFVEVPQYNNEKPFNEVIEDARLDFHAKYNKTRKISYLIMGAVMLASIGAVILITLEPMVCKIIGWALVVLAIGGMIAFYLSNKNKMPTLTQDYIKVVNNTLNSYIFTDPKITNVKVNPKEKIEASVLTNDGIYEEVGNIASRNVLKGEYEGKGFTVADLGIYNKEVGRKQKSYFVGKYLATTNELHFTDRYVISSFSKEPVDLPTGVSDLEVIISDTNFVVYGKAGSNPEKDLGKGFIKTLKEIEIDETLLGFSVVVWAGRTIGYFSYADEIMTLPFQSEFSGKQNIKYRKDTLTALEAFSTLK